MKKKPEIWVVDVPDTIATIEDAFKAERLACQIVTFTGAVSLYRHIEETSSLPAILIVEYTLPLENGLIIAEHLLSHPLSREVKLVLLSADITAEVIDKAQAIGVYQIERQPVDFQQWRRFVKELCLVGHFT